VSTACVNGCQYTHLLSNVLATEIPRLPYVPGVGVGQIDPLPRLSPRDTAWTFYLEWNEYHEEPGSCLSKNSMAGRGR